MRKVVFTILFSLPLLYSDILFLDFTIMTIQGSYSSFVNVSISESSYSILLFLKISISRFLSIQNVRFFFYFKTRPAVTPYCSYRAFAMQEICSTSHLKISPERPAAGNTCASMENLRNLSPKTLQIDEFWGDFFDPKSEMKDGALTHLESIDLGIPSVIPNQNNMF